MSAGLLFVAALHVGPGPDGLPVGHLGRFQIYFRVIPLLHLGDSDLDVLLPCSRDQELFGLRIAEETQHGVFLHQPMDTNAQLVFIGPALGLNRERDGGLRQIYFAVPDRP